MPIPTTATLTLTRPSHTPRFTIFMPNERHDPDQPSPFRVSGLATQWHRVASLARGDLVEVVALSPDPLVGALPVTRVSGAVPASTADEGRTYLTAGAFVETEVVSSPATRRKNPPAAVKPRPAPMQLVFMHEDIGSALTLDAAAASEVLEDGPAMTRRHRYRTVAVNGVTIGVHEWWELFAHADQALLTLLFVTQHAAYFDEIQLFGETWDCVVPEPAADPVGERLCQTVEALGEGLSTERQLLRPGVSREYRLAVGRGARAYCRRTVGQRGGSGLGSITDYWRSSEVGGYLPQGMPVGPMDHIPNLQSLTASKLQSHLDAIAANLPEPNITGSTPPAKLYPGRLPAYGPFAGGEDREKEKGAEFASTGWYDFYDMLLIEGVRDVCRQPGIHHDLVTGDGVDPGQEAADNGGVLLYKTFANRYIDGTSGPTADWWDEQIGECPYETTLSKVPGSGGWDPYDEQHLDRMLGDRLAMIWLGNDPCSKHLLRAQLFMNWRSYWNGSGGITQPYSGTPGYGTEWGRAWGQVATFMCGLHAITPPDTQEGAILRGRLEEWLTTYVEHLATAQMETGLCNTHGTGSKPSKQEPFGHQEQLACHRSPAIHSLVPGSGTEVSDWKAGRAPESVELISGLRSVRNTLGMAAADDIIGPFCQGLQDYAWRRFVAGTTTVDQVNGTELGYGVVDRFPVSLAEDDIPFADRFSVPADCVAQWNADPAANGGLYGDSQRLFHAIVCGWLAGQALPEATLAVCRQASDLQQALTNLKALGRNNFGNFSSMLAVISEALGV